MPAPMHLFILRHFDALIMAALGVVASICALRAKPRLGATPQQQLGYRVLPWVGPGMFVIGMLSLLVDESPPVSWSRYSTRDNVASAEFPGTPQDTPNAD